MKNYYIQVRYDAPYPRTMEYRIKATGFSVAVARALRLFRKEVARKVIKSFVVKVTVI